MRLADSRPGVCGDRGARVGIHTKALSVAFGARGIAQAVCGAGVDGVVVWSETDPDDLRRSIQHFIDCGVAVWGAAIPKISGYSKFFAHFERVRSLVPVNLASVPLHGPDVRAEWLALNLALSGLPGPRPALSLENLSARAEVFGDVLAAQDSATATGGQLSLDLGHALVAGQASRLELVRTDVVAWYELHDNDGEHDLHLPLGSGAPAGSCMALLRRMPRKPNPRIVLESNPAAVGARSPGEFADCYRREAALCRTEFS